MKRITELRIRMADRSDFEEILALYAGAIQKMRLSGIDQWDEFYPDRADLLRDVERGEMLLLTENGEPVSAAVVNAEQPPEYGPIGWQIRRSDPPGVIHRLCVSSKAQGRKLGARTLDAAERFARASGYHYIRLDTFPKNPAAVRLYESAGYRKAGSVIFRKGIFFCYEKLLDGVK